MQRSVLRLLLPRLAARTATCSHHHHQQQRVIISKWTRSYSTGEKNRGPVLSKELRAEFVVPTAADLKSKLAEVYLIDVREPHEVASGRVEGAKRYLNLPIGQVVASLRLTPPEFSAKYGAEMPGKEDDDVVIMCLAGIRSTWALQAYHEAGFTKVKHFPGGWAEWKQTYPHD